MVRGRDGHPRIHIVLGRSASGVKILDNSYILEIILIVGEIRILQKAKVGSKGEIFPPKEIREKLGLRPGTELDFKVEDSKLIVQAIPKVNDLLKQPPKVEITLQDFHKFRRQLSKKAESF